MKIDWSTISKIFARSISDFGFFIKRDINFLILFPQASSSSSTATSATTSSPSHSIASSDAGGNDIDNLLKGIDLGPPSTGLYIFDYFVNLFLISIYCATL